MDVQSESNEPPACEPPPPSRINKAAFKLFGRRKPGSAVPAIFSMRGKGEGSKAAAKTPLVRSKTHDGLAEGVRGEQGAPEEPTEAPCEAAPPLPPPSRPSISSVASVKSLSFLTLLRGGSRRGGSASRRGGLRGLLGNVRWPRRARGSEDRRDEAPPPSDVLLASRSNSVEIVKEHMTLTPRPPPRTLDTSPMDSGMPSEGQRRSGLQSARPLSVATSPGSPPAVPCMDLLSSVLADISSLGSFDSPAACGDIALDTKTQVLRAGTSTEQDSGQGEAALLEKATPVSVLDPQLILTPGFSSTSPKIPASTAPSATAPSVSTATSTPSLSLTTSSTPASTIPFVPTSKSAPIKTNPVPIPPITSSSKTSPVPTPTITSVPKTTPFPTPTITSDSKPSPIPTLTITSHPQTTPVPTPTITSAPKITPFSIPPVPTPIPNITHPTAIEPAPYPISSITAPQTPTTVFICTSKSTILTTSTPTMTSLHVLKPVPVTTCTPASAPTSTTTCTTVSKHVPVCTTSPTITSTSVQKPCPSLSTTSPITPHLTATTVTTSDPKLTPISTITSVPVPTVSPITTIPLVPFTTSATSPAFAPKTVFAPDSTKVTKPADAPVPREEAHSSTDEVGEDGEAVSCKLDLQKDFHSPSLPQSSFPEAGPFLHPEKKLPSVSKIPVSGRPGKNPRDAVPDKGHLDLGTPIDTPSSTPAATPVVTPAVTPGPEDECVGFTAQWNSSRGDVHHPNVDPPEVLEMSSKFTPPTRAPGATRTTRIPVKQTQLVHSTRQGAPIQPYPAQAKTEVPRTKIPVSKVPVRRGSNKPPTTHQSPHDLARK